MRDNIWRRISLSVLISTQNKDRLCKCQAVCFGQLKANFSCADERHDDNDGDDDGNEVITVYACNKSLSCMSHSIVWYYNHYRNDYTSSLNYTYHRGYKRLQKTAQGHHDGNDYDVNDYKDKEDK